MRKILQDKPTVYGPSQTKPGQSLRPNELLKRHLAGTLPDIAQRAEYTHDEMGNQIAENLANLELHELHELAGKMREEYDKRQAALKEESAAEYRKRIIEEYKAEHAKSQEPNSTAPEPGKGFSPNRRDSEKTPTSVSEVSSRSPRKGDGAAGSSVKKDA